MESMTDEKRPNEKKINPASLVRIGERGIMLRSLDDLLGFAAMAARAGAIPKGMNEGGAAIAIQAGLEHGLGPLGGLTQGLVINGVFSWRGQGAAALIRNSGTCKPGTLDFGYHGEGEDAVGWAVAHRVGYAKQSLREFSVKDARRAKLWNKAGPWQEYPHRQLMWRALGFLARDVFSDVLGGFPLYEEAIDFDENEKIERSPEGARPELPPPTSPDPLMAVIKGTPPTTAGEKSDGNDVREVVDAQLVAAAPTEAERPSLLDSIKSAWTGRRTSEDTCTHGRPRSVGCAFCEEEDKLAIRKAELKEGAP